MGMESQGKPDKETLDKWLRDPTNYRKFLGLSIYYNPKDKRILPPRKVSCIGIGINSLGLLPPNGWAINFANPYSILVATGITIASIVIVLAIFT
jgi:uncharacterized membrane protein